MPERARATTAADSSASTPASLPARPAGEPPGSSAGVPPVPRRGRAAATWAAVGAYAWWGTIAPIYFRETSDASSLAVLGLRILSGVPLLFLWLLLTSNLRAVAAAFRTPGTLLPLTLSAALVGVNWLTFIVAVSTGRTLAASFGYYLNPLLSVALGVLVLGERLGRGQVVAIVLAGAGVGWQAVAIGSFPWISLTLAGSFALYGLLRKRTQVDPAVGLTVEMLLLCVPAIGLLLLTPVDALAVGSVGDALLLGAAGVVTVVPLVLFAVGARGLRLSTIGMLQYLAPTGQFLCAVLLFGEALSVHRVIAFGFVWSGLAIYVASFWNRSRRGRGSRTTEAARPAGRWWARAAAAVPAALLIAAALYWSGLSAGSLLRGSLAVAGVAITMGVALRAGGAGRALVHSWAVVALIAIPWSWIPARTDRHWTIDAARQPTIEVADARIVIHDFRDFRWRSVEDADAVREVREFDPDRVEGVDFLVSSWGSARIVHTFLSFRFENSEPICISIEVRRERGEQYHPIPGLFKHYELIYQVGSERDFIGVRVLHRGESVSLYPTNATPEQSRMLLLSMLNAGSRLHREPRFYHSIGRNCTTQLVRHVDLVLESPIPWSSALLLNGWSPAEAARLGLIDPVALESAHRCIDDAVRAAVDAGDPDGASFSRRIRGDRAP